MKKINRRSFVKAAGTVAAFGAVGCSHYSIAATGGKKKVVIVGGGTAGATLTTEDTLHPRPLM